ncbi:hypothetical protein B4N89_36315 [Embleya scabrispora]|uniref:Uncharacterized protein n=1 Tax=Embleya scabrispora TaxID=159449 RepID=A0A1T3NM46_9ACTN|nr:hypothetical protein [Embleya scabrispora]OPC77755.1 hypothetical protein B4N89_36315 [Embleya scabrispora]
MAEHKSEDSSSSLPDRLQPLLDHQFAFERAHLACPHAAGTGNDDTLNHCRAERLRAMHALPVVTGSVLRPV